MEKDTNTIALSRKWMWIGVGLIVILFLAVLFLLFNSNRGVKVSTSGVEISPPVNTQKDTVTPSVQPTIKERVVYRSVVNEQQRPKTISVKTGDTSVVVEGQPAIVNTGTNNGIMGNNNSVTVNPKPTLNADEKRQLIAYVDKKLKEYEKDKTTCIYVIAPVNSPNPETKSFAYDIERFLLANGYNVKRWPALQYARKMFTKTTIDFYCEKGFGECCTIEVWLN